MKLIQMNFYSIHLLYRIPTLILGKFPKKKVKVTPNLVYYRNKLKYRKPSSEVRTETKYFKWVIFDGFMAEYDKKKIFW